MKAASGTPSKFTFYHIEVLLLAGTLLTTIAISALTLRQTTRNFAIQRTSAFVERLNSKDLVAIREHVDRWVRKKESASDLYAHSLGEKLDAALTAAQKLAATEAAIDTIADLRTLTNFFQEFGTALKIDSLDEHYAHALIGGLCIRYGKDLKPFIDETRWRTKRDTAYSEVELLKARMELLDEEEAKINARKLPAVSR